MEPRTLTLDEIRQAVAIHAPERLASYDDMTSTPATNPDNGAAVLWTETLRVRLMLAMWSAYDPKRPN